MEGAGSCPSLSRKTSSWSSVLASLTRFCSSIAIAYFTAQLISNAFHVSFTNFTQWHLIVEIFTELKLGWSETFRERMIFICLKVIPEHVCRSMCWYSGGGRCDTCLQWLPSHPCYNIGHMCEMICLSFAGYSEIFYLMPHFTEILMIFLSFAGSSWSLRGFLILEFKWFLSF